MTGMPTAGAPSADRMQGPRFLHAHALTVFDIVGLAFAAFDLVWAVGTVMAVQPKLGKLLADFGGELPPFTRLCLQPWFPVVLAAIPVALVGVGILRCATRKTRAALMGATIFLALALPAGFLIGVYLPIFAISDAIR